MNTLLKASLIAAMTFSVSAQESGDNQPKYIMKMKASASSPTETKFKIPSWETVNSSVSFSAWMDTGAPYNCSAPTPPANLVDYGVQFTQNYSCEQKQTRTKTSALSSDRLGTTRPSAAVLEEQVVTIALSQGSVGTRNFIVEQVYKPYSEWSQTAVSACGDWSPGADTVSLDEVFTQSRTCSGSFSRQRDVFDLYADGSEEFSNVEADSKVEPVTQIQQAVGTKNERVFQGNYVEYTYHSSAPQSCSSYSPSRSTVNYGDSFTQSRTCQARNYYTATTYAGYSDGSREYVSERLETYNAGAAYTQNRSSTGTKDYVVSSAWTAWEWEYSCAHVGVDQYQNRQLVSTFASGARRATQYESRIRQSTGC